MGNAIPQYQIKAHTYPVNAISIDDNGDFIGSCCQEGKVRFDNEIIFFNNHRFIDRLKFLVYSLKMMIN
jgi:hypothetical protein